MAKFNDSRYNELHETAMNIFNSTKVQIDEYFNNNFNGKYKVINFYTHTLRIGVLVGTYKDNTPRYREIDIYHGYDYKYIWKSEMKAVKYFQFETNIGGCGSFDILGESEDNKEIYEYYMMVANILSNKKFSTGLKNILIKMADDIAPLNDEMEDITRRYNEIEAQRIAEEKANIEKEKFNKSLLMYANSSQDDYVIIETGHGGNFIYRKQPVKIIEINADYNKLYKIMENIHKETGTNVKIVEIRKVKFNN